MLNILVVQPSPCPKRVTFISVKVLDAAGITPLQEKSELYITRIVFSLNFKFYVSSHR